VFEEICDILIKSTARSDCKEEMWFDALRTLFKMKDKADKDGAVNRVLLNKISEFLQLMSKYVEFNKVIDVLLESDKKANFRYVKDWFKNIFVSKNDQEFLYRSAKVLLSNENTIMIDSIIERAESGFKGNVYFD
jgi:hypothetical protein